MLSLHFLLSELLLVLHLFWENLTGCFSYCVEILVVFALLLLKLLFPLYFCSNFVVLIFSLIKFLLVLFKQIWKVIFYILCKFLLPLRLFSLLNFVVFLPWTNLSNYFSIVARTLLLSILAKLCCLNIYCIYVPQTSLPFKLLLFKVYCLLHSYRSDFVAFTRLLGKLFTFRCANFVVHPYTPFEQIRQHIASFRLSSLLKLSCLRSVLDKLPNHIFDILCVQSKPNIELFIWL